MCVSQLLSSPSGRGAGGEGGGAALWLRQRRLRLLLTLVRFGGSSLLAAGVDYLVFTVAMILTEHLLASFVISRVMALTVNYAVNRRVVFRSEAPVRRQLLRFLGVAAVVMTLHWLSARTILHYWPIHPVLARIMGESVIFLFSFTIQRLFVFRHVPWMVDSRDESE